MKLSSTPNRTNAPVPADHLHMQLDEPKCVVLDNGMKACFIEAGQEDVTRIDIIFNAGSALQKKRLVAAATNRLLREGTKNHSSFEVASLIDYHGAYLDASVTKDTATLTLYSLNKHLPELLPLLSEIVHEPVFPQEELHTYIQKQRQEFLVNNTKVKYRGMTGFNSLVFGTKSAYGQLLNEADFDLLELQDVVDFYHQFYVPNNAWILASGKIDGQLPQWLNAYFGQSAADKNFVMPQLTYVEDYIPGGNHYDEKADAMQSAIRIGRPIMEKSHPDYNAMKLLNTILGGYFGSRLMSNLREEKGYTYGIGSYLVNYRKAGFFSVATEVNAQYTDASLSEICHEMKRLREEPVGEEELLLVKNYLYGTFLRSFDGPFSLSDRYISAHDNNLQFSYYRQSLDAMMHTNSEQLMEVANRYLVPDNMIRLIVGKKENPIV